MKKPLLSELSLRDKIGQTGCICSGALVGKKNRQEIIANNGFGAMWVTGDQDFMKDYISYEDGNFGHKPTAEEANNWAKEIIKLFKIPPLLPSDAESGVGSVRNGMSYHHRGKAYSVTGEPALFGKCGELVGEEFRASTLNWIFAPVCDVCSGYTEKRSVREYGDYQTISDMTSAYIKGIQSKGVAACIKHFPSPGPTEVRNTHISPSDNNMTLDQWKATQGKVYQRAIDEGVMTIMTSHTSFPAVDATMLKKNVCIPASLSSKVVIDLLKKAMGFKGVVITDDMSMRAARLHYNEKELYVKYLQSGHDMLLGIIDPNYVDIVEAAVRSGELSEERINDACQRVLDLKEKLGLFDEDHEFVIPLTAEHKQQMLDHNLSVARKCIETKINTSVPFANVKNVGIVVQKKTPESTYSHFRKALEDRGITVSVQDGLFYSTDLPNFVEDKDLVVYFVSNDREHQTTRWILTEAAERSVVLAVGSPLFYEEIAMDAENFFHVYSLLPETQIALAEKILK